MLFLTQRDDGINAPGTASRKVAGAQPQHQQNARGTCGNSQVCLAVLNTLRHRVHACRYYTHYQNCQRDADA
jgi:hypothetical protein